MTKITVFKILLTACIVLVMPVAKVQASNPSPSPVVVAIKHDDLRVVALQRMFEEHNSPLEPYAKDYIDLADKYGLDWELLPAIAGIESSFGTNLNTGTYNAYGWGRGHISFASWEDGIDTVMASLRTKYASRGATTVESIAPIYSESPTWAPRVRKFMAEIDAEYDKAGTHQLSLTI